MSGDAAGRWQVEAAESGGVSSATSAMLDAVEDAVLLCDASSGRVVDANLAGCRLLGCPRERCGEANFSDCSVPEEGYTSARAVEQLTRALATDSTRFAWRNQRADGSRFWSEVRAVRAPEARGMARTLVIAVVRDNSAERAAADVQAALQRSEERLARIVQTAPEPMTILREKDSVVTYVNPAFETLFAWPSADAIGKRTAELNVWSDPDQRAMVLEQFRRERRVDSTLVKVRTRDGRLVEGLLSLRPIDVEGIPSILTSFRDISELQGARAELEASETRLRALAEATFEGIGILHEGVVVDTNEQLATMYGTTREALLGRPVTDLVAPESLDLVRSRIEQRLDGAYEHLGIRQDGSIFPVEVRARSVVLGGRSMRLTAIRDMTDRKRAEAERERLIGELQTRNAEMEQFTYTVSHDLKSPLVTISGFLGAIERDLRAGNLERAALDLNRIRSASAKMSALLNDLLELSRIGRIGGMLEPVSMAAVAREAAELVAGALGDGRIELVIAADLPVVRGDRARLVQVLQNLFDNAAKYMGDQVRPRVEVAVRPDEQPWVFYVRDNGIGIDPKYAERIFGLFEKLDPKSAGTGIGLALVRRIVEFHGGRIWVESDGHQGSTFCFRLPRGAGDPGEPQGKVA
jgi:PAS domain S-box-containing protein